MRVLVSGGTGIVGRFVVEHLLAHGHAVVAGVHRVATEMPFSRHVDTVTLTLDPTIAPSAVFERIDGFVHAAFQHVPGRYRGGEGDDPQGFRSTNLDGSLRLFEAARKAGVSRCVFLSSRAVYGPQPGGLRLTEEMAPRPESLYGDIKLAAEQALAAMITDRFVTASIRATGVYGAAPGMPHKWEKLAAAYLAGEPVEDRIGTEVHGEDLAAAALLLLTADATLVAGRVFNASDILTSHRDVLSEVQQTTGCLQALPRPADRDGYNVMDTGRLRSLGWHPGGSDRFRKDVADLAARLSCF